MSENKPLTIMGEETPRVVIYKHESHKLHQAFSVKLDSGKPVKIAKGQPVAILHDGTIKPYTGVNTEIYLGIAVTDSINPAYEGQRNFPVEVTVAVQGFAICNYISAAANLGCGYVVPDGNLVHDRFTQVKTATDTTNFIAISGADNANEIVQVIVR